MRLQGRGEIEGGGRVPWAQAIGDPLRDADDRYPCEAAQALAADGAQPVCLSGWRHRTHGADGIDRHRDLVLAGPLHQLVGRMQHAGAGLDLSCPDPRRPTAHAPRTLQLVHGPALAPVAAQDHDGLAGAAGELGQAIAELAGTQHPSGAFRADLTEGGGDGVVRQGSASGE
ncbi:MAG: hypothetical protein CMJ94_04565 [Planctomycetes bacterium]|nr:hypothetical protein [Planctomycetota bacterium]